jgi:hypothetical protein
MTLSDIIQLSDPVEHRGIVVCPLFPRRDPVAAYVTLDEALAGGLTVREVDEAGSVPELVVETRSTRASSSTTARSSSAPSRTASST